MKIKDKRFGVKTAEEFAEIVKKRVWADNVRASTRGMDPGFVLIDNQFVVFCADRYPEKLPPNCDFSAVVVDYGDHQRVKIYDRNGKYRKGLLHRKGRLGIEIVP